MGAVAMKIKFGRKMFFESEPGTDGSGDNRKATRECAVLAAGLFLILLVLSRYIVNGEPVDVRSDEVESTTSLPLYDGVKIWQPLTIIEEMNWRQGYYALRFAACDRDSDGWLVCTLEQGQTVQSGMIKLSEIEAEEWTRLDSLNMGALECGEATLCLSTVDVEEGEFALLAGNDYYGFGNVDYNGSEKDLTLAQAYHYHITGTEYRIRLLCYGIVALCMVTLVMLVSSRRIGSRGKCLAAFFVMTALFMAVIYILDSSIYLEPTYAEAVTNFLHYAREESFFHNFLIEDAGYLPLLPRLITLFYVKALRLSSEYALYFMQATACLLCSMVWAFFVLYPFEWLTGLSNRILWCILIMMTCFHEETLFFTNHGYWGIYLLLLLLLADLNAFPRLVCIVLMAASAVICLTKGTYVVMMPLMFLYLLFFHKSIGKRDKVFAWVTASAAFLQLLYSFGGQGDGSGWIDAASMGQIGYWFRLVGRVFVEFAAYLLTPFGRYAQSRSGLVLTLALVSAAFLAVHFVATVFVPRMQGQRIDRCRIVLYMAVFFQLIVSAFYLVTVKSVPASWKEMGNISFRAMGHKYEIFSDAGFYLLLLAGGILLIQKGRERISRYGILLLIILFTLSNPIMRLQGWTDAEVSDHRVYAGDINASWWDHKEMITESAFFIPVRADNWGYGRNASLYQVGAEVYFEEVSNINLEATIPGYHSAYELSPEMVNENLIEVMIERPARIDRPVCMIQLLDADDQVIAEVQQADSGRNKKSLFRLTTPVNGTRTIRFLDAEGEPIYFKDYIAWVCAW